jgi:hypothetical protein
MTENKINYLINDMSKKSNSLPKPTSIDDSSPPKNTSTTKLNLPDGWTRTTVVMREDHLQKLKDLAYWGRASSQSEVLEEILDKFFSTRTIPPIPEKKKILEDD